MKTICEIRKELVMSRFFGAMVATAFTVTALGQLAAQPVQWTVASGGNGLWYEGVYVGSNTLWTYANAVATAEGGYLASVTSAAENAFIVNSVVSDPKYWCTNSSGVFGPWVGGYQYDKLNEPAGDWAWTDGAPWSYTNWATGEPNNAYNREDYLQLAKYGTTDSYGSWNDQMNSAEWCTVYGYVVEYKSYPTVNVQTVSFQQGVNNYTGTTDTMILQSAPNQTNQSATTLSVVNNPGYSSEGLLQFSNIIGNGAGQVPPGAKIVSAMLQWTTSTTSNTNCELHRMLVPWSDATATWNSMGGGISANGVQAVATPDIIVSPTGTSAAPQTTVNVTQSLQAWAGGAANDGWAMLPDGNQTWSFSSCEGSGPPVLTVSYELPANNSVLGVSVASISLGRVMLNHVPTTSVTVSLTGGTSPTGFSVSASGGATAMASGNGPGAIPPSGAVAIGLTNATGSYSGVVQVQNSGDDGTGDGPGSDGAGQGNAQSPIAIPVTGTVVDNRVVVATPASFGPVHVGAALSQSITLSTTGDDNHYTRVTVPNPSAPDGNGMSVAGGANPTFNGPAVSDTRTVSGTATTAGILSGTIMLATSGEGLTGEQPVSVPVTYTAQVFSGSGAWNSTSGSLWSQNGNWTDTNGSGVQAAPGSFAGFNNTDTAIFNGAGSVTVIDLTGVNPSLNALSFSNSNYTLSNGSLTLNGSSGTASVTVSSGTQSISTPITLANNANFAVNGGALLLNSTINGSGGLVKSGPGQLLLSGADTASFMGGITVNQGTLSAPYGIPFGGAGIAVASGGTLQAGETVARAVSGNGTVTATAQLIIGNATQTGQFNMGGGPGSGGTLNVGSNAVLILSADAAILGSQTNIGAGGSLTTLNGAQLGNPTSLDTSKVLTAIGNATINGNFVNNGLVNGPTGSGQELTFTQAVQGAGSTTGNVEYAGSYKVGNSPAAVSVQDVLFDSTSTLILDVSGDVPGSGYDQLNISGMATLNGTLELDLLNGFTPSAGESFHILSGSTTGSFAHEVLPSLPNGLTWDTSSLEATGTISVVPEPDTLALLAAGAIAMVGFGLRRKM
jgi:autotransporter-associated beta strand protein